MNWLDIAIIVVLGISFFSGLKQGIIKAAISLAGMALGVTLASRYYILLARRLTFIPQNMANIAAFAVIFLATMIVAAIIAKVLSAAISVVMLGWLNRLGGGAFGVLMGGIMCGAALALWIKWRGPNNIITNSSLAAILLDKFPIVLNLLPKEFGIIQRFFQK